MADFAPLFFYLSNFIFIYNVSFLFYKIYNNMEINIKKKGKSPKENNIFLKKMSDLLTDICDESKKETNLFYKPLKCFYSNIPYISIKDYLEHIYKYSKINSSTIALILIYIDRICNVTIALILIYIDRICNVTKCKLSYYIIHKLILGAMILAIKYNEDVFCSLKFYAKLGGISLNELYNLEVNFISLINFNLFVSDELFRKYNDYLLSSDSDDDDESDNWDI